MSTRWERGPVAMVSAVQLGWRSAVTQGRAGSAPLPRLPPSQRTHPRLHPTCHSPPPHLPTIKKNQVIADLYDKAAKTGSFGTPPTLPAAYSRVCIANPALVGSGACSGVRTGRALLALLQQPLPLLTAAAALAAAPMPCLPHPPPHASCPVFTSCAPLPTLSPPNRPLQIDPGDYRVHVPGWRTAGEARCDNVPGQISFVKAHVNAEHEFSVWGNVGH